MVTKDAVTLFVHGRIADAERRKEIALAYCSDPQVKAWFDLWGAKPAEITDYRTGTIDYEVVMSRELYLPKAQKDAEDSTHLTTFPSKTPKDW